MPFRNGANAGKFSTPDREQPPLGRLLSVRAPRGLQKTGSQLERHATLVSNLTISFPGNFTPMKNSGFGLLYIPFGLLFIVGFVAFLFWACVLPA
jgi:hypothetical protein